jgi:TPP-dependent pyruvate/acetoin dehydrogenase alpha subunit
MAKENPYTPEDLIAFEEELIEHFENSEIAAPVHFSRGNEEQLIHFFEENVTPTDYVLSTWRSHYHALLHGIPREWVHTEVMEGRSITLVNREHNFYASAIVGGICPIAVGIGLSLSRKYQNDKKVFCFIGDMTYRAGIAKESISYTRNFNLPVTWVVEDNMMSVKTNTRDAWGEGKDPLLDAPGWLEDNVYYYSYHAPLPHQGSGKWVVF